MTAKKGVTIKVTEHHIRNAKIGMPSACMVHRAIEDAFPDIDLRFFEVGYGFLMLSSGRPIVKLPPGVGDKIRRWDKRRPTKPFEFDLTPSQVAKLKKDHDEDQGHQETH